MKCTARSFALIAPLSLALVAKADYQLDINGGSNNYINADLTTYSGGANYSAGGTVLAIGGVNFQLAKFGTATTGGQPDVGIVQAGLGNPSTYQYTGLSIAGSSNTVLYTLLNTAFGFFVGEPEGTVDVYGTGGAHSTLTLIEGGNIRDHFQDGFVNTIADPTVVPTYFNNRATSSDPNFGPDRLDRQQLVLGSAFNGQTITEVDFNFITSGSGQPFLAAATFHTPAGTPEPFTMGIGIAGIGLFLRRRRIAKA